MALRAGSTPKSAPRQTEVARAAATAQIGVARAVVGFALVAVVGDTVGDVCLAVRGGRLLGVLRLA